MPIFRPRKVTFFPFLILFKRIESIDMTPCVISFLVKYLRKYRVAVYKFRSVYLKIKNLFFNLYDVMKTVGGA